MVWLNTGGYLHEVLLTFCVSLTLAFAKWNMFFYISWLYLHLFFPFLPPLSFVQSLSCISLYCPCYLNLRSSGLPEEHVAAFLFCLFPKTFFSLLVFGQLICSSYFYMISCLCPPGFFKASGLCLKQRNYDIWRNSWRFSVLRVSQLLGNDQWSFCRPRAVNSAQLLNHCLSDVLQFVLHFEL